MSRVAVVTGGASGMGRAICRELADQGHRIAVLDIDGAGAHAVAESLRGSGADAAAWEVDVADQASVVTSVREVREELGPTEIVVTSAGLGPFEDFTEIGLESWNRTIAVNLTGTFVCIQATVRDMVDAGWGRIVTVSSAAAQQGVPRLAPYSAAKGGVIALTKSLAREYGPAGITVNTIAPGMIDTPMIRRAQTDGDMPPSEALVTRIPVGRVGDPEEIAATCGFLCSDGAAYITGQVVAVNGGLVI